MSKNWGTFIGIILVFWPFILIYIAMIFDKQKREP